MWGGRRPGAPVWRGWPRRGGAPGLPQARPAAGPPPGPTKRASPPPAAADTAPTHADHITAETGHAPGAPAHPDALTNSAPEPPIPAPRVASGGDGAAGPRYSDPFVPTRAADAGPGPAPAAAAPQ